MKVRCPECIEASRGDGTERVGFVFSARTSESDRRELMKAMMALGPIERPPITEEQDRAMWEGFAATRPECLCRGTGYRLRVVPSEGEQL